MGIFYCRYKNTGLCGIAWVIKYSPPSSQETRSYNLCYKLIKPHPLNIQFSYCCYSERESNPTRHSSDTQKSSSSPKFRFLMDSLPLFVLMTALSLGLNCSTPSLVIMHLVYLQSSIISPLSYHFAKPNEANSFLLLL